MYLQKTLHTIIHISAIQMVARSMNINVQQLMNKQMWNIPASGIFSAMKRNGVLTPATKWTGLENMMLSKTWSQMITYMIPCT